MLWLFFARETFDWHAIATLATWMMTVFIQRAEHRDAQALHAKLDHLLVRIDATEGQMAQIDRMQPEGIEEFRERTALGDDCWHPCVLTKGARHRRNRVAALVA